MATRSDHPQDAAADDKPYRASLTLELRATERQILVSFREAFLRWIHSQSSGGFGREAGPPGNISFEESSGAPGERSTTALLLRIVWPSREAAALASRRDPGVSLTPFDPTVASPDSSSPKQFVFFPDEVVDAPPLYQLPPMPPGAAQVPVIAENKPRRKLPSGYPIFEIISSVGRRRLAGVGPAIQHAARHVGTHTIAAARAVAHLPELARQFQPQLAALRLPRFGHFYAILGTLLLVVAIAVLATSQLRPAHPELPAPQNGESVARVIDSAPAVVHEGLLPISSAPETPDEPATAPTPPAAAKAPAAPRAGARPDRQRSGASSNSTPRSTAGAPAAAAPAVSPQQASAEKSSVGTLLVDSEPSGAEVSINGIAHGRTPLMVEALSAGSRVVRVELEGYERWSWAVTVVANKRTPVRVRLQPDRRGAFPGS